MEPVETLQDPDFQSLAAEARSYLEQHAWCRGVRHLWLADGWPGILGVFQAEIDPAGNADERLWVVVGDVPPIYLDSPLTATAAEVLADYVAVFREWVQAVRNGEPVDALVPVTYRGSLRPLEPTPELVEELSTRLNLIEAMLIPEAARPGEEAPQ